MSVLRTQRRLPRRSKPRQPELQQRLLLQRNLRLHPGWRAVRRRVLRLLRHVLHLRRQRRLLLQHAADLAGAGGGGSARVASLVKTARRSSPASRRGPAAAGSSAPPPPRPPAPGISCPDRPPSPPASRLPSGRRTTSGSNPAGPRSP